MKITVEQSRFVSLLAKAQNIVERRNAMPVLVNILLETDSDLVRVFATDLEVSLTDEVPVQVTEPGRVVVNGRHLFDIVKELSPGPIEISSRENFGIGLSQNKAIFNIVGINPEEYPVFPT